MKFLKIGLLFLLTLGVVALIALAYTRVAVPIISKFDFRKPCVPFAQKEVPDENDGNWEKISYERSGDDIGETDMRVGYEHKQAIGLKLSVYSFFG